MSGYGHTEENVHHAGKTFHTNEMIPVDRGSADSSVYEIRRYGDSGVATVEGITAGARAGRLSKAREQEKEEFAKQKRQIESEHRSVKVRKVDDRFNSYNDSFEKEFRAKTVGLVTADQFRKAQEDALKKEEKAAKKEMKKKKKKKKKVKTSTLSFGDALDDGEEAASPKVKNLKNPNVDTDFLPDKQREEEQKKQRMLLQEEWTKKQGKLKEEVVEITYSYWDGSGHRRETKLKKKNSIGQFLEIVRQALSKEFPELRGVSSENLLYIKEDLIIPHHFTFYDLIVTKARGKSGPLFHFDVHDDVRLLNDARVEKDESHPGKIVERSWYERNKHIFPASRWEVYDPAVKRERYTIHGDEVNTKK